MRDGLKRFRKSDGKSRITGRKRRTSMLILLALGVYAFLFFCAGMVFSPKRYDLAAGDVAQETIKATKDVEDKVRTDELIKVAVASVKDIYVKDMIIAESVQRELTDFFYEADKLYWEGQSMLEEFLKTPDPSVQATPDPAAGLNGTMEPGATVRPTARPTAAVPTNPPKTADEFEFDDVFLAKSKSALGIELSMSELLYMLTAPRESTELLKSTVIDVVSSALIDGVKGDELDEKLNELTAQVRRVLSDSTAGEIAATLIDEKLVANYHYDEASTLAARDKAKAEVTPIIYKTGETIVRDGERVSAAQLAVLDSLGLLAQKSIDIKSYIGIGGLLAILEALVICYILRYEKDLLNNFRMLLLVSTMVVLLAGLTLILGSTLPEVIPIAFSAMVIALMLHTRLAIIVNITLSIFVGLLSGGETGMLSTKMISVMLVGIAGGTAASYILKNAQSRMMPFYTGAIVGGINMATYLAFGLMSTDSITALLNGALWCLLGGAVSGIITAGLLPVFEVVFGIVTPIRLLELSNPNQPLMQRLMQEAPGTYHHCIIVGNLAQRAANEIGANGLLARAGAFYHDVGKLKRPYFFIENQYGGNNPHNNITPELSSMIITSHTTDGVRLAKEYKLPLVIQDIIAQHHGNATMVYFYAKAREQAKDPDTVKIEDFKYHGPTPGTPEAGIIMLADGIEAAARASKDQTLTAMRALIHRMIKQILDDGQLNNCALTMKDLSIIEESFFQSMSGSLHERIEYPSIEAVKRE